jgi:hypothetical protein
MDVDARPELGRQAFAPGPLYDLGHAEVGLVRILPMKESGGDPDFVGNL